MMRWGLAVRQSMRHLHRLLVVGALLLFAGNGPASGQSLREIDEPAYHEQASAQYWDFLRQSPCTVLGADQREYASLPAALRDRQALLRRTGPVPDGPAGQTIERHTVSNGGGYRIEFVRFASRLNGVGSFGYWAQPGPNARGSLAPVVILINGAGTTPAQAFGWRLPGDGSLVNVHDSSAFVGLGTSLVEAGYAVLSLWLNDQRQFDPLSPWLILDRWGAAYRATAGEGGAYSLILPQVMAAIDFARKQPGIARGQIAIGGWEEGSQIAAVSAALDPRIGAVVRLTPVVDWVGFRDSKLGIRHGASFTQMNCALGDVVLDGLIAPRPLLHIASDDDPYAPLYRPFLRSALEQRIRDRYADTAGGAPTFLRVPRARQVAPQVVAFLNAVLQGMAYSPSDARTSSDTSTVARRSGKPNADEKYPFTFRDEQQSEVAKYIAATGVCRQVSYTPDFSSPENYRQRLKTIADTLKAIGGFRTGPARERQQLLSRRLLRTSPNYDLEYVKYGTPSGVLDVQGLLATPRNMAGQHAAIISLNGNDGMKRNFGIAPFPPEPYLNGVADYFANRGNIVFVPYLPRWFPEVGSAILRARDPGGVTSWSYLLPYYMSTVDVMLANPNVDSTRIGLFGISYAGDAALTTAAFDPRVTSLVYSNRSVDMRKAYSRSQDLAYRLVWSTDLCSLMDTEFKMLAPRRLVWEAGDDPLFNDPNITYIHGLQDLYEKLGAKSAFQFVRHSGGHETRPEGYRFFDSTGQY